jgi:hypothetical protein
VRLAISLLTALLLSLSLLTPADAARPIEDYASYVQPKKCHPRPYPGTAYLGRWVARHHGGGYVGTSRSCPRKRGATSDHQTGRAFDWAADVSRRSDRKQVRALLHELFEKDRQGNPDARARRMGIVYVIWADHMYAAWSGFRPEPYLSSGCTSKKKCSKTLRHRNHVHVSLSKAGAKGRTSWYDGRL